MQVAFKEWAVVVDALERGVQVLILRKGGISEESGVFRLEHDRFLLFPTLFHQQHQQVVPAAAARFDVLQAEMPEPEIVRIRSFAEVMASWRLDSLAAAERLRGQHVWRDEVIADRFDWGGELAIHALILRVWRLPAAVDLPLRPEYGGCKSWIELATDVPVEGATPALSDTEFALRWRAVADAVEGGR